MFSAHQRELMEIELCIERCRDAYFKRHPRLHQTIVRQELRKPRRVEHSDRKAPLTKQVKEELSNPAFLSRSRMDGQRGSEKPAKLLGSKLTEPQVFTSQELRHCQRRLPPESLDLRNFHSFFPCWNSRCRLPLRKDLHRRSKRIEICFKSASVKHHNKTDPHAAVDVAGAHCERG